MWLRAAIEAGIIPLAEQPETPTRADLHARISGAAQTAYLTAPQDSPIGDAIANAVMAVLPTAMVGQPETVPAVDRATVLRVREYLESRLDQVAVDPAEIFNILTGATEPPLSRYYSHESCGFHWHGSDGMDVPMRDGQPVCPRLSLIHI